MVQNGAVEEGITRAKASIIQPEVGSPFWPTTPTKYGGLAQLGERLPCKQEVTGSIPVLSTTVRKRLNEISVITEVSLSFFETHVHLEN